MTEEVGRQHVDAVSNLALLFPASVRRVAVVAVGDRRSARCQQYKPTSYCTSLPSQGLEPGRGYTITTTVGDARPVWRQTDGYLPSPRASLTSAL